MSNTTAFRTTAFQMTDDDLEPAFVERSARYLQDRGLGAIEIRDALVSELDLRQATAESIVAKIAA